MCAQQEHRALAEPPFYQGLFTAHELTEHQPSYSFSATNQVEMLTRVTNERVV